MSKTRGITRTRKIMTMKTMGRLLSNILLTIVVELTTDALVAAADLLEIFSKFSATLANTFVAFPDSFEVALLVALVELSDPTIEGGWADVDW
jgi:hypothetical protein